MARCYTFICLLLLIACAGRPALTREQIPVEAAGYRLTSVEPLGTIPEPARQLGVGSAWSANYSGPAGPVRVQFFDMKDERVAFELQQRWHAEPGTQVFHRGPVFVVLRGDALVPLAQALQQRISPVQ